MRKRERGIDFVAVPQLGIHTRDDLDAQCHYELDLGVNTYLTIRSQLSGSNLHLVAVNPDGDRRASNDFLCFWWPQQEAQEIKNHYQNAPLGTDEFRMDVREWERRKKGVRRGLTELWKQSQAIAEEKRQAVNKVIQKHDDYYRRLLERGCD